MWHKKKKKKKKNACIEKKQQLKTKNNNCIIVETAILECNIQCKSNDIPNWQSIAKNRYRLQMIGCDEKFYCRQLGDPQIFFLVPNFLVAMGNC